MHHASMHQRRKMLHDDGNFPNFFGMWVQNVSKTLLYNTVYYYHTYNTSPDGGGLAVSES